MTEKRLDVVLDGVEVTRRERADDCRGVLRLILVPRIVLVASGGDGLRETGEGGLDALREFDLRLPRPTLLRLLLLLLQTGKTLVRSAAFSSSDLRRRPDSTFSF